MLWLLSFDDDKNTLADAVDKYCIGVPPIQWLAWIPQLLTCLVGSEGKLLLNLISQVGSVGAAGLQRGGGGDRVHRCSSRVSSHQLCPAGQAGPL